MFEDKRFIYRFGKFALDPQEKTLFLEGAPLHLPAKEFETLLFLVENNNRALTKEEMLAAIWRDAFVEEGNLAKQISRLRKLFNSDGESFIQTLPKRGYRFSADVRRVFQPAEEPILEKRTVKRLTLRIENKIEEPPVALPAPKKRFFTATRIVLLLLCLCIVPLALAVQWFRSAGTKNEKINSVAVLPLRSLTAGDGSEDLGLGLADALISKIGSLRSISVRPINSVAKFTGIETDALEIGKNLNVDAVLEGTIQQSEGRIRLNVRLLRVEDGEQLWMETFDGESAKVFDLEDRLSEQTARVLSLKSGMGENEHLTKRFTTNPEAFDDYLKGRFFWNKRTADGFRQAIGYFNSAVQKDPNYAQAYSGLADCYILLGVWGVNQPKEVFPQAAQFADKALQADPELAEALVARAFVKWVYDWDFQGADADFSRAIELNPNYATAHHWYAYFLVSQKKNDAARSERAIDEIKKAREIEGPLNISVNTDVGEIYLWAGKYAEAERHLRDVLKIEPDYAVAHHVLAINLLKQNRIQEAIDEAETAHRLESEPRVLAVLAFAYAAGGERDKALKMLDELNELSKRKYVSPFSKAVAHTGLGNHAAALDELEKAYSERSDAMAILGIYPLLEVLHTDPRFIELQKKVAQMPH